MYLVQLLPIYFYLFSNYLIQVQISKYPDRKKMAFVAAKMIILNTDHN